MLNQDERVDVFSELLIANSLVSEFEPSALTVQQNGDLTFFLAYKKSHNFSGVIFSSDTEVAVHMSMGFFKTDAKEIEQMAEKMKKISAGSSFKESEGNWMRFCFDKKFRNILVVALIKVNKSMETSRAAALFYYDGKMTALLKNISDNWEIFN
jgi:hypothetical protein